MVIISHATTPAWLLCFLPVGVSFSFALRFPRAPFPFNCYNLGQPHKKWPEVGIASRYRTRSEVSRSICSMVRIHHSIRGGMRENDKLPRNS